jgi:hypothetical protein
MLTVREIKKVYRHLPQVHFDDINITTSLRVKKDNKDIWAEINIFIGGMAVGDILIQHDNTFFTLQYTYFDKGHRSAYKNCKVKETINIYKHYLILMGFKYMGNNYE